MLFKNCLLDSKKASNILSSYDDLLWSETETSVISWKKKLDLSFFIF